MQPVNDDDQSPDDAHLQEEEPDDGLIARAGDSDVSIDDLIQFLRLSLNWTVIEQLIERTLIEKAFEENEIELTDQELDAFVETYRADRGLLTARETERWLNENKLTADDLYDLCEFEAKQDRLKKLLFNEETIRARF